MKIRLTKKDQVQQKPQINRKLYRLRIFSLLAVVVLGFSMSEVNAQSLRVNISQQNITIREVLQSIEKQTTYLFVYNPSDIEMDKKINVNMNDATVKDILSNILEGQNLSFYQEGNNIILQKSSPQVKEAKKQITGTVKDIDGEGLIGASVSIKGTKTGTVTDINGSFSISASVGNVIEVSYIGYVSQTITVSNQSKYDFVLRENERELEAVVITALGIKRSEKALSYNAQQVSQNDILANKDVNFINALAGKVAGVTINSSSSGVGSASKVVIRGQKSIEGSNNVMYVIDGIPMYNFVKSQGTEHQSQGSSESIADINPEDIESMTVLTGAAASALYGSDAANGVVVITTKKGKAGHTSLTVSQSTEFRNFYIGPKFQDSYGTGLGGVSQSVNVTDRSWGKKLNEANRYPYSPKEDYFRTGIVTTETVALSTGSEKNQTYISAAFVNSAGMVPNNSYDRYNFTGRNTTLLLKDKMTIDIGASYIKQKDMNMTNQGEYHNPLITSYLFPRGNDWDDVKMYEEWKIDRKISEQRWNYGIADFNGQNPYWINHRNLRANNKDRYMLHANVNYEILDWLSITGRARIDNTANDYTEKLYASTPTLFTEGSKNGLYGIEQSKDKQIYADFLVNINKTFNERFSISANIGASTTDKGNKYTKVRGPILDRINAQGLKESGVPNVFQLQNLDYSQSNPFQGGYSIRSRALFASAEFGYKGAYYLTLTGRNEWASQLVGPNSNKSSFFYPSVGTSILLSEILPLPKQINYMKLRASFASIGLPYQEFLATEMLPWSGSGYSSNYAYYPMSNLKPERTDSWELGLTVRFLEDFNFDVSLYHARTYNQTINARLSASSGYDRFYVQSGKVRNQGIELSLGYKKEWGDFKWASNYTFTANGNKIEELVKDFKHPISGDIINKDILDVGGYSNVRFILKEGGSLGDLYAMSSLRRDDKGYIYINENGKPEVERAGEGEIKLGSVDPKCNMAWNNSFSWRNINLSFLITARLGGIVYSPTQAVLDEYGVSEASAIARDRGGVMINGGDLVNPEKWYTTVASARGIPELYTYSATNVRLQELSIGYTFPKKMLWGVAEASIALVGRNLWMLHNKAPFDPETVATTDNYYRGIDLFMMPSTRNFGFNVRLTF